MRVFTSIAALCIGFAANGATFYLAPTGSDTIGDGTAAKPWATAFTAYSHMASGDTLVVKNGTYSGLVLLGRWVLPPNGTPAAYTTVQGESYGGVIIEGAG